MKYFSTRQDKTTSGVSLKEAALSGLAPDGGLYLPQSVPILTRETIAKLPGLSFNDIAFQIALPYVESDISHSELHDIIDSNLTFAPKLVLVEENIYALELFHGPTLAFKDFGASFMAGLFKVLKQKSSDCTTTTILAATSGDTGSAVGQAFKNIPGFRVVLLFPAGKVSPIQEAQLTTIGANVSALKIAGSFDDCQRMVKQAFGDATLNQKISLSSANSINIARLIPQAFYYAWGWASLPHSVMPLVYSVPSGNFGNLTAGLLAQRMGIPIQHFVAATNANDPVPTYLETGGYVAKSSVATMSNAMDVGNPSNFERMTALFGHSHGAMVEAISGCVVSEDETAQAMRWLHSLGYISDPHAAVGYCALKRHLARSNKMDVCSVFLATAHPAKFSESVESCIGEIPDVPEALRLCTMAKPQYTELSCDYEGLKDFLLSGVV
jgi:threonine synthase